LSYNASIQANVYKTEMGMHMVIFAKLVNNATFGQNEMYPVQTQLCTNDTKNRKWHIKIIMHNNMQRSCISNDFNTQ